MSEGISLCRILGHLIQLCREGRVCLFDSGLHSLRPRFCMIRRYLRYCIFFGVISLVSRAMIRALAHLL